VTFPNETMLLCPQSERAINFTSLSFQYLLIPHSADGKTYPSCLPLKLNSRDRRR